MLVSENMRGARRSVQQRGEVAPGPPGGEVLQRFTAGEHQNDDERRDVLAHGEGCDHRHHREDVEPDMPAKHITHHPNQRPHDERSDVGRRRPPSHRIRSDGVEDHDRGEHHDGDRDDRVSPQRPQQAHTSQPCRLLHSPLGRV